MTICAIPAGAAPRVFRSLCAAALVFMLAAGPLAAQDEPSTKYYGQESINAGLDDPPPLLDRETPRAAFRGFQEAAEAGRFRRAAHFLNLAEVPPEEQPEVGPEIARRLALIIERQVWVDWNGLPSRPDAMIEMTGSSDPRAGQARRTLRIATMEARETLYDIRISRYKPAEGDPVWLFSPQTIRAVPALFGLYGPRQYETYIPQILKREFAGLWLWEWIALPTLGAVTLFLGWLARCAALWLSGRTRRGWLSHALERSGLPLAILVMAAFVQILLAWVLSFSGPVNSILRPLLTMFMVWGVGMALLRVVDAILNRITLRFVGDIDDKRSADEREIYTSIYALRRLIVLVMVGFAAIVMMNWLNLFDTVGMALLASAGVLTVIAGIAGQAVLGNIMASLQIAFAKPVRIGDSVLFEGDWAYVEAIFYTFLRLRTWDHRRIIVPVKYFVSKPFENWSVTEARMMKAVTLRLDHRADIAELRQTFERLIAEDEDIRDEQGAFAYATDHGAEGLEISFYAMMPDPSTGWTAQCRLREHLLTWIAENHPDWWPRERVLSADGAEHRAAAE